MQVSRLQGKQVALAAVIGLTALLGSLGALPLGAAAAGRPGGQGRATADAAGARPPGIENTEQVLPDARTAPGQFRAPHGVAVDGYGNVYVADTHNHRIQKLSAAGEPLAQWGRQGSGPGQFRLPNGVAVDGQGHLYVADTGNHRIQKLSALGEPLAQFGS